MIRSHGFARLLGILFSWGLLVTLMLLMPASAPAQSTISGSQVTSHHGSTLSDESPNVLPEPLSDKQKQSIMRANFEKSKSDAAELAALAKGLREELDKPNVSVLSPEIINRAEKIEKLAKRIRDETKGF